VSSGSIGRRILLIRPVRLREDARQGGVLFCGEHTSTEFQGFMEGGASEGKRAAKQLARILGRE
jgi:hypothetical protein